MGMKSLLRKSAQGKIKLEIKKIEKKLATVSDKDARNKLISQLNTFLKLDNQKIQYKRFT